MSNKQKSGSVFERAFDIAVVGSGYAGLSAALGAKSEGLDVLLVGPLGDLVWESGRAFLPALGRSDDASWKAFVDRLRARGGADDVRADGATAEIVATDILEASGVSVLYYAHPVAMETKDGLAHSLVVATKSGCRRVRARRWIDATENGLLLRMVRPEALGRKAAESSLRYFCQFAPGRKIEHVEPAEGLRIASSVMPGEAVIERTFNRPVVAAAQILPTLRMVEAAMPGWLEGGVLSHGSIVASGAYEGASEAESAGNVMSASPAFSSARVATLADRYELGLYAAREAGSLPAADADAAGRSEAATFPKCEALLEADVAVAGAGTAGALAAIAAARAGSDVICFDPLPFPGGIGSGGGIHSYYYGVSGGLQDEVDRRVDEATVLMGGMDRVKGFHPEAKKAVLYEMMTEAGARFLPGAALADVEVSGGRILSAGIAGEDGPARVAARTWIDCTGDGDLCGLAGAEDMGGRRADGLLHAYSQPVGLLSDDIRVGGSNFDAGWTDPADAEDLTRARIKSILHYLRDGFHGQRPTYIAPALGLRQGRHILTDYVVTLADQMERRRFDDVIGFQSCHCDNHAIDFQFESDEQLFWMWVGKMWRVDIGCEIPYRAMLPKALKNVLVACRALGVSPDAHNSFRMQRDLQRTGEAAGIAASLACGMDGECRRVPYGELARKLDATGALDRKDVVPTPDPRERLAAGLKAIAEGRLSSDLWFVYSQKDLAKTEVERFLASAGGTTGWLAAIVAAMWGEASAEPRLIKAIESRELGYDEEEPTVPCGQANRPEKNVLVVDRWVQALAFLRMCGTERCVGALAEAARDPNMPLVARTATALTVERLVERKVLDAVAAGGILESLMAGRIIGACRRPRDGFGAILQAYHKLRAGEDVEAEKLALAPADGGVYNRLDPAESHLWQLDLVVARTRRRLGLALQPGAERYLDDPRSFVRRAFEDIVQPGAANITTVQATRAATA